ncbi:MAG TPA: hypothetical protein EYH45_05585 [Candidatus Caldiarchaeum subterraneum]|uniref:Protein phosphatase n=1 Tax=Caldiarchaeum subterraneum TaxID=311458 RepID=A0A833EC91_CALS0|nr:hypothetical protein [Candidatus Caldarchaeum subterraneum]
MGIFLRRIQAKILRKPANFSWVDNCIAASAVPDGSKHLRWLKQQGIEAILCLVEKPVNREEADRLGMEYIHIPMKDHQPPDVGDLIKAVQHIRRVTSEGRKILIHCAAGMGRTGTVLAAYLIISKGMNPQEAIGYIRRLRPGSIEYGQEKSLYRLGETTREGI